MSSAFPGWRRRPRLASISPVQKRATSALDGVRPASAARWLRTMAHRFSPETTVHVPFAGLAGGGGGGGGAGGGWGRAASGAYMGGLGLSRRCIVAPSVPGAEADEAATVGAGASAAAQVGVAHTAAATPTPAAASSTVRSPGRVTRSTALTRA